MKLVRMTRLLAALVIAGVVPAHANGVSSQITSGEAKTGTLSGEGFDTYSFPAAAGGMIMAVVSETGVHDDNFIIGVERTEPGGASRGKWKTYSTEMEDEGTKQGTWTFKVSRAEHGATGTGGYKFNVVQVPVAGATAMSAGQNYDGSLAQGDIKAYSFAGTAGQARTLTLSQTSGNGYPPKLSVYAADGTLIVGKGCTPACETTVQTAANGTYTVLLTRYDEGGDASGYRLSVNSAQ